MCNLYKLVIGIFWEGSYIFGLKRQFGVNRHVQPKYLIPIIIDIWSMKIMFHLRKEKLQLPILPANALTVIMIHI